LIGEAVGQLTPDLTDTIPTVPWSKIKAMRNLLIHRYWAIDMQTVWSVIHNDLPGLKKAIEDHLA
jgi:uncharacterized protein with HEPN domain